MNRKISTNQKNGIRVIKVNLYKLLRAQYSVRQSRKYRSTQRTAKRCVSSEDLNALSNKY